MKRIFGFIIPESFYDDLPIWSDVFEDERRSPEFIISPACHIYYDIDGTRFIGFDLVLGIPKEEMIELLRPHSNSLGVYKVL